MPVCSAGFIVFVAQGIVSQSVTQFVSMMLPTGVALLPVRLNDIAGTVIAKVKKIRLILHQRNVNKAEPNFIINKICMLC